MQLDKFKTLEGLAAALRTVFGFGKFGVYARVYNNANITIGNDSTTALTFNTESSDSDNIHSTVTNTGRLTCNTSGFYIISGSVEFASSSTGRRIIYIRTAGSNIITQHSINAMSTGTTRMSISTQVYLSATQYAELLVYQSSGGDLDVLASNYYSPYFSMSRIA